MDCGGFCSQLVYVIQASTEQEACDIVKRDSKWDIYIENDNIDYKECDCEFMGEFINLTCTSNKVLSMHDCDECSI